MLQSAADSHSRPGSRAKQQPAATAIAAMFDDVPHLLLESEDCVFLIWKAIFLYRLDLGSQMH